MTDTTTQEQREGCGYLCNAKHAHYFRDARSLCRKWLGLDPQWSKAGEPVFNGATGRAYLGRERCCAECFRKREHETRAARGPVPPGQWSLAVQTSDVAGNRSCPSQAIPVNWQVDAPQAAKDGPQATVLYDVFGRRVTPPLPPGVYWQKTGRSVKKVLVLR